MKRAPMRDSKTWNSPKDRSVICSNLKTLALDTTFIEYPKQWASMSCSPGGGGGAEWWGEVMEGGGTF